MEAHMARCNGREDVLAQVRFTSNLQRHLSCPSVQVLGGSVRDVLEGVFQANPRLRSYLLDDQGRLRKHVKLFVNNNAIADPRGLTDRVGDADEVFVFQALSGG
jgi:molybdopterin synthase sulfur carrier subunit